MSMAHSLELRVPFLDREVFAVASRIPVKHRIAGGTTKYALRLAAERHLPKASTARPKLGFPVPVRIWLRQKPYYDRVKTAFTGPAAERFLRHRSCSASSTNILRASGTTTARSGRCTCSSSGMGSIFRKMPAPDPACVRRSGKKAGSPVQPGVNGLDKFRFW